MEHDRAINVTRLYIRRLAQEGLPITAAYLYGSYAHGAPRWDSDIDVAVVSPAFSGAPFADARKLLPAAVQTDSRIQPMPFTPELFAQDWHPLVGQIKKTGVRVTL